MQQDTNRKLIGEDISVGRTKLNQEILVGVNVKSMLQTIRYFKVYVAG